MVCLLAREISRAPHKRARPRANKSANRNVSHVEKDRFAHIQTQFPLARWTQRSEARDIPIGGIQMFKKLNWRIVALIAFVIAAGGFIYWNVSTVQQLKQELAKDDPLLEQNDEQVAAKEPPPAAPGKKWVPHGDHFHEVPIDAPDVWQGEPHALVAKDDIPVYEPPVTQTYFGPLTFHEELLKTNPVKALRLQSEERGHWSKDWIPPFPPDDEEAQEFARNEYLTNYYKSIGDTDNPELEKAVRRTLSMMDTIRTYPFGPRAYDLMKLTWPSLEAGSVLHTDSTPSDYFPNYHTEKGLELLKPYYPHVDIDPIR